MKRTWFVLFLFLLMPVIALCGDAPENVDVVPIDKPLFDIWNGVLDIPGNSDLISSYSIKNDELSAGYGFGVLRIARWVTVDIALSKSQSEKAVGTNVSVPLSRLFKENGSVALIWPSLQKLEVGLNLMWGYSFETDEDGNTFFTWKKSPDYGISLMLRY
jgi:hypothetical protein